MGTRSRISGAHGVLVGFSSGKYEAIDLSNWIAGNPAGVLATKFSKPAALFQKFPHKGVFIAEQGRPAGLTCVSPTARGAR